MSNKNPDRKVRELDKDFSQTSTEGKIRENLAIVKLLRAGYRVSTPIVEYRYDLLVERHPYFMRIQVKNLKLEYRKDPLQPRAIDQYVIRAFSAPNREKSTYTKNDTDFILGINIETENFAIIPVEDVPSSGILNISEQSRRKKYFNTFTAIEEYTGGDFNN